MAEQQLVDQESETHDVGQVWKATLGALEVSLSKANFTTWFKNTRIIQIDDDLATVGVPNTFAQEWLRSKYHEQILAQLREFYPNLRRIDYHVATAHTAPAPDAVLPHGTGPASAPAEATNESGLNPSHTFATFVVGSSNRLAHAAAAAVAKNLGAAQYNPFYIYGGVGLGKTHLLQAIGNEVRRTHPKKTIIYASAERFTTEFIEALQGKKLEAFKKRYRNADLLLIDDIQFLTSKEATQEEFFHTFNTLHQTNRQIVMTSDTRPQMIPQLAPRLSSRFGWGMVADIQSPDLETRQAILRHKCQEKGVVFPSDVLEYVAQRVQSNIRELEGFLNTVAAHCQLYGIEPSLKLVQQLIEQAGADRRNIHLSADVICDTVAEFYSLDRVELLGKRRHKELVHPRQITMYLMRSEMSFSYPKIGKALGGKDHTTVMHGVEKITKELVGNEALQRELSLLKERLYSTA
ncbi:chromosomal replication initiator protein DnaA [Candidatus Berkelbacteria bacterium]|nr:chromosomal replication initiator protein DnaA [Candidatus Berkelbacteria bacterium]